MSRVASNPILLPDGVEVKIEGKRVTASGKMGELSYDCLLYTSDAADE